MHCNKKRGLDETKLTLLGDLRKSCVLSRLALVLFVQMTFDRGVFVVAVVVEDGVLNLEWWYTCIFQRT
jgi:hypothetical protein